VGFVPQDIKGQCRASLIQYIWLLAFCSGELGFDQETRVLEWIELEGVKWIGGGVEWSGVDGIGVGWDWNWNGGCGNWRGGLGVDWIGWRGVDWIGGGGLDWREWIGLEGVDWIGGRWIGLEGGGLARLGVPATTVLEVLLKPDKVAAKKGITSIEDWVVCFNTYVSVVALRNPQRVRDTLAYLSTIVKASKGYVGSPWLEYDV
jgi:hypothetical protein